MSRDEYASEIQATLTMIPGYTGPGGDLGASAASDYSMG